MTGKAFILPIMLATLAAVPLPAQSLRQDYPSCDLTQQRTLKAPTGGTIRDPRQSHIAMRANILQADISTARKARRLSQAEAQTLWNTVAGIHRDANRFVAKQGFLSAGETASYDRALDGVAMRVCRG
ncbi:hypothetical protein NS355_03770 [Sphingomonas yabuuchiae]|uniref:Uncharacterized protein n=1 Tax=Sphingomonas yabuuchiae TaxID=172044 RepID=A0A147IY71_9SPHN|nr:hypothetical protein [Sphingomonas yabuuchiae]KTW00739.1 hypothetical protein NS355_03770 [Sphingomonas yabuuchiae]